MRYKQPGIGIGMFIMIRKEIEEGRDGRIGWRGDHGRSQGDSEFRSCYGLSSGSLTD